MNKRTVNEGRHDVANRKATCTGMLLTCDNFVTCNTDTLGILKEELKEDDLFLERKIEWHVDVRTSRDRFFVILNI